MSPCRLYSEREPCIIQYDIFETKDKKLPESILKFVSSIMKKKSSHDVLVHCKRELFHATWRMLLDDEFVDAYRDGIVIICHDSKKHRVFPRIFTYSADYPEK